MANQELPIVQAFLKVIREFFSRGSDMLHSSMQNLLSFMIQVTLGTPHPVPKNGFFFGAPKAQPWTSIYSYFTSVILPLTVILIGVSLALITFTGIFGRFLSGYERSRSKRRFFMGFLFVLVWWGVGGFTLRVADLFATAVAPDVSSVASALAKGMSTDGMNIAMSTVFSTIESAVVLSVVFVYLLRWVAIYSLMLGMPVIVALWIVDIGPFAYLSDIAGRLALKFIPLAFITIPISIIYRVAHLFFDTLDITQVFSNPAGAFAFALGFPLLTLVVAYVVFFKGRDVVSMTTDREAQVVTSPAPQETQPDVSIYKGREDRVLETESRQNQRNDIPGRQDVYSGRESAATSSNRRQKGIESLQRSRSKINDIRTE